MNNQPNDIEFTDILVQFLTKLSHMVIKQQIIINYQNQEISNILQHLQLNPKRTKPNLPDNVDF